MRKGMIEAFIYIGQSHSVSQALQNQRHRKASAADGKTASEESRVGHNHRLVF